MAALVGQFQNLSFCQFYAKLPDAGGHMDRSEEILQCFNAFQDGFFRFRVVIGNTHYIHRELGKARNIIEIYIACPASPDCRQSCSMGHIKHPAQLVLQLMAGPVTCSAAAGQSVVGQASRPENFRTGVIILRIFQQNLCLMHHCL